MCATLQITTEVRGLVMGMGRSPKEWERAYNVIERVSQGIDATDYRQEGDVGDGYREEYRERPLTLRAT